MKYSATIIYAIIWTYGHGMVDNGVDDDDDDDDDEIEIEEEDVDYDAKEIVWKVV